MRLFQSAQKRKRDQRTRRTTRSSRFEPLESRCLLSTISWVNPATSGFADDERDVVNAAIELWEQLIDNFNDASGTNTLEVAFSKVNVVDDNGMQKLGSTSVVSTIEGRRSAHHHSPHHTIRCTASRSADGCW